MFSNANLFSDLKAFDGGLPKKVGKKTRPFRQDLNQIWDDYTVKVRNVFKGLDLIE